MAQLIRTRLYALLTDRRLARTFLGLIALGMTGVGKADIADLSAPTLDRGLTRENFFDWVDFDADDMVLSWPSLNPELAANRWTPYLAERFTYDDNIFRLPSAGAVPGAASIGVRHDDINTLSAGIDGNLSVSGQRLEILARADDNRFLQHGDLDNVSANVRGLYAWTLGNSLSGQVGGSYNRALTDFTDYYLVTQSFIFTKDIVSTRSLFATAQMQLGSHWLLAAGVNHTDISQTADPGDEFKGDTPTFRAAYNTFGGGVVALEYQYARGDYGLPLDINGFPVDRDFREQTARIQLAAPLGDTLHLLASAGYVRHDYPQASSYDFAAGIWDASLSWQAGAKTQVLLTGSQRVYADIDAQAQYFVSKTARAIVQWSPTGKLKTELEFSREDQHFIGPNATAATLNEATRNLIYSKRLNLAWSVSRALQLVLSGRLGNRDSNAPALTYDDALVSVSVRGRL